MDQMAVIAKAQELVRLLEEPERLGGLAQSLATVAGLLRDHAGLIERLAGLKTDVQRAEAESASRLEKCRQRETIAARQQEEATGGRQRALATLDQRRDEITAEIATLTAERQVMRNAIERARAEQTDVLAGLALEHRAALQALEGARAALSTLRAAIPA